MSPNKGILVLLLLAILLPSSLACLCSRIPTLRTLFYGPSRNLVRAKVTQVKGSGLRALYVFETEQNYKGCPPPKIFSYKASGNSCDVFFEKGESYILALAPGPVQSFNLCGYQPQVDNLSREEKEFLNGRQNCCKGVCTCVRRPPTINCLIAPCDPIIEPPCEEAVKCVDTPCAPCQAEWLKADGGAACEPRFPN